MGSKDEMWGGILSGLGRGMSGYSQGRLQNQMLEFRARQQREREEHNRKIQAMMEKQFGQRVREYEEAPGRALEAGKQQAMADYLFSGTRRREKIAGEKRAHGYRMKEIEAQSAARQAQPEQQYATYWAIAESLVDGKYAPHHVTGDWRKSPQFNEQMLLAGVGTPLFEQKTATQAETQEGHARRADEIRTIVNELVEGGGIRSPAFRQRLIGIEQTGGPGEVDKAMGLELQADIEDYEMLERYGLAGDESPERQAALKSGALGEQMEETYKRALVELGEQTASAGAGVPVPNFDVWYQQTFTPAEREAIDLKLGIGGARQMFVKYVYGGARKLMQAGGAGKDYLDFLSRAKPFTEELAESAEREAEMTRRGYIKPYTGIGG